MLFKELILERKEKELIIPVSLFNHQLGALETIVKYLRENLGFKFLKISSLINRNISTVLTTYRKAKKKRRLSTRNRHSPQIPHVI